MWAVSAGGTYSYHYALEGCEGIDPETSFLVTTHALGLIWARYGLSRSALCSTTQWGSKIHCAG